MFLGMLLLRMQVEQQLTKSNWISQHSTPISIPRHNIPRKLDQNMYSRQTRISQKNVFIEMSYFITPRQTRL
jgi:hypothetical protein